MNRVEMIGVNVSALERFENDSTVCINCLVEAGLVKAVGIGETTVTATYEGQSAQVEVIVEALVEDQPELPLPGAGKVTICVQVPAPLCEGSFVVIPGSLTYLWARVKTLPMGYCLTNKNWRNYEEI